MVIGAQLYTVREYTQTQDDFRKTLKRIADTGYRAVQISAVGNFSPEFIRETADSNNLEICITHTNPTRILNDTDQVIKDHRIMGCKHVGIGSRPAAYENSTGGYRSFLKDFGSAALKLKENGLKLHYHNHNFEFERFGNVTGYDILVAETDPKMWGFILDTYWVQAGGSSPVELIRKLKGRIDCIHFKDMKIKDGRQCMAPVGDGNLNWQEIMKATDDAGTEYILVEQDTDFTDPFDALETSYKYIDKLIGGK